MAAVTSCENALYYNQISVHQNPLGKMDAHQQQDALVHLFRNDGVLNRLGNEASLYLLVSLFL